MQPRSLRLRCNGRAWDVCDAFSSGGKSLPDPLAIATAALPRAGWHPFKGRPLRVVDGWEVLGNTSSTGGCDTSLEASGLELGARARQVVKIGLQGVESCGITALVTGLCNSGRTGGPQLMGGYPQQMIKIRSERLCTWISGKMGMRRNVQWHRIVSGIDPDLVPRKRTSAIARAMHTTV